ncbi:MAG: hypothetical protein JOZ10_15775 [Acidobacteria bacterium]|nr:hypothetical protein [Acidobacteriota bacterium]MBV9147451.1 hypothetical protein [Acidobacteriota bacterium]MBV9435485.1 hypothetical protein [Acidobacteriota bacterium]
MAEQLQAVSYEDALAWLRNHQFDVLDAPGVSNRVFLKKYGVSAAIQRDQEGGVRLFAKPGYLISGEIARLVDKGYQKFLKTTKAEIPATADHLKAIHNFSEELKEATGSISLYNEGLGTVSDRYVYDRVTDRDEPEVMRPVRPWEAKKAKSNKKKQ